MALNSTHRKVSIEQINPLKRASFYPSYGNVNNISGRCLKKNFELWLCTRGTQQNAAMSALENFKQSNAYF